MNDSHSETDEHPASKRQKLFHQDSLPTLQHDRYTIAWICALHIEMAAAQAMLDKVHEIPPRNPDDTNSYVLGSIKGHNIVIACLPEGQYGTINSATVATNLKRTFSGIHIALMVGIGGGVPSKLDIRLGDVVVGTRIMQYDLGKIVADGKFERIAVPRIQQPLLGTALNSLRAKHELNPSRVPYILQRKLESYTDYCRPSTSDRLFQATYEHASQTSSCDLCDQSEIISRSGRQSGTIKIHHGAIASGNQVMKHGTTRDNVARELDVICFEMEAAGPMDIIPCLPIRGICDYSDSHKNKEWQRYAAATAAAYARELIEELPLTKEQSAAACVSNPVQVTPENRRQRLMKSLEFKQMESRRMTIKSNHAKTCQWLLEHPDYKAWLDPARLSQHYGFLWISGKPGAGKSTIMKFAYLNMKKARHGNKTASFFFNARGELLEKTTSGMYRSLLLQLLEEYRDLRTVLDDPDIIPESQEECPPLNTLKDLFRNAISALSQRQFTCFVDALDECDEQQVMDMVEFFEDLGEQARENGIPFRICFSSRHYPYIVLKRGIRLTLEDQSGHADDLATYIGSRLRINNRVLTEELKPELLRKAAGVFIWVVLVVQILNEEYRRGGLALRKRLSEIPSDLSKLFKEILTRDNDKADSLLLCVRWILFAARPLKPEEFRHALWSGLSLKDLADSEIPGAIHAEDMHSLDIVVISSSKGLAEITKSKSPTVQFIHESVRDFFLKDNGLNELWPGLQADWESSSHEKLKQCCKFYFDQPSVSSSFQDLAPASKPSMQEEILKEFPFLEYATQNLLYHANAAAESILQSEFLSNFPLSSWIKMNNFFEKHKIREYTSAANLFYILADKGYASLVRSRLQDDTRDQIVGERYRYPIFAALAGGHKATVAAILNTTSIIDDDGVDFTDGLNNRNDLKGYKGKTPLSWAAQNGHLGIAKCLLEAGCAVDEVDRGGQTALARAFSNWHKSMIELLVERGADINARIQDGSTPLSYASQWGQLKTVQTLINKGADVNTEDKDGLTPLSHASDKGHLETVELLIDNKADVDQKGRTALIWASKSGHEAITRLLIDNGADVNICTQSRKTALICASIEGYEAVTRLLIDNGADVNICDQSRRTALIWASTNGHEAVTRLLIDKGADINIRDQSGRTALIWASMMGHEAVAKLFITKGGHSSAAA